MVLARWVREGISRWVGWGRLRSELVELVELAELEVEVGRERTVKEASTGIGMSLKVFVDDDADVDADVEVKVELEVERAEGEEDDGGMERTTRCVVGSAV